MEAAGEGGATVDRDEGTSRSRRVSDMVKTLEARAGKPLGETLSGTLSATTRPGFDRQDDGAFNSLLGETKRRVSTSKAGRAGEGKVGEILSVFDPIRKARLSSDDGMSLHSTVNPGMTSRAQSKVWPADGFESRQQSRRKWKMDGTERGSRWVLDDPGQDSEQSKGKEEDVGTTQVLKASASSLSSVPSSLGSVRQQSKVVSRLSEKEKAVGEKVQALGMSKDKEEELRSVDDTRGPQTRTTAWQRSNIARPSSGSPALDDKGLNERVDEYLRRKIEEKGDAGQQGQVSKPVESPPLGSKNTGTNQHKGKGEEGHDDLGQGSKMVISPPQGGSLFDKLQSKGKEIPGLEGASLMNEHQKTMQGKGKEIGAGGDPEKSLEASGSGSAMPSKLDFSLENVIVGAMSSSDDEESIDPDSRRESLGGDGSHAPAVAPAAGLESSTRSPPEGDGAEALSAGPEGASSSKNSAAGNEEEASTSGGGKREHGQEGEGKGGPEDTNAAMHRDVFDPAFQGFTMGTIRRGLPPIGSKGKKGDPNLLVPEYSRMGSTMYENYSNTSTPRSETSTGPSSFGTGSTGQVEGETSGEDRKAGPSTPGRGSMESSDQEEKVWTPRSAQLLGANKGSSPLHVMVVKENMKKDMAAELNQQYPLRRVSKQFIEPGSPDKSSNPTTPVGAKVPAEGAAVQSPATTTSPKGKNADWMERDPRYNSLWEAEPQKLSPEEEDAAADGSTAAPADATHTVPSIAPIARQRSMKMTRVQQPVELLPNELQRGWLMKWRRHKRPYKWEWRLFILRDEKVMRYYREVSDGRLELRGVIDLVSITWWSEDMVNGLFTKGGEVTGTCFAFQASQLNKNGRPHDFVLKAGSVEGKEEWIKMTKMQIETVRQGQAGKSTYVASPKGYSQSPEMNSIVKERPSMEEVDGVKPIKKGWLLKWRHKFPYKWERRLFVLQNNHQIVYYQEAAGGVLTEKGRIGLSSLEWSDKDNELELCFEANQVSKHRRRKFRLRADSHVPDVEYSNPTQAIMSWRATIQLAKTHELSSMDAAERAQVMQSAASQRASAPSKPLHRSASKIVFRESHSNPMATQGIGSGSSDAWVTSSSSYALRDSKGAAND